MGLDLKFYEIKNYDWDEYQKKHEIEEVLELSNSKGMLIVNWLYRNNNGKMVGNYLDYHNIYHQIHGDALVDIYKNLKKVINAPEDKKDNYALHYFPALYTIDDWVSMVEMFSDGYYHDLEDLYEIFDNLLFGDNSPSPSRRIFFYNINW